MGSATTTCWGREASTSSPGAPTSWRGSCRPRPGARARSRGREVALTHGPIPAYLFKAGLRWFQAAPATERFFAVRWDGGAYQLVAPHRQGRRLPSPTGPPPGWSPSSTPTDASAPSSRPPTTGPSRASASTASRDAFTPLGLSCGSGSASTATPPRWTGCRCFTVRTPASGSRTRSRNRHELPFQRQGSNRDMPYCLDNAFLLDNPWITVVGCGGTGGFVAEGLCRLLQGRQATIVLVDHDRVEPHNLLRQNYYPEDEGRFKSQALADRLARAYRASRRLLGLPHTERGLPPRWTPLSRPSLLRQLPAHRLRRQRRRAAGNGREPAGCPRRWLIDAVNVADEHLRRTRLRVFDGGSSPKPI